MNKIATENGVTMSSAPELKATLTLPQTAFPMKANLPQNEPLRLRHWASLRLYEELRKAGQGRPVYLLHDGPPYANGPIHLGHALNKGLKDFVVKSKTMAGYDAPFVPGYDCHGLPIEIKVEEQLGRKRLELPKAAILEACRAYAQKYVDLQTQQFERIGCFGRWQTPYKTMARSYEARTLEAFFGFLEKGFVYRGLKPVYWCIHDRTALAEAEVEYENHTSPSIYVRYRLTSDAAAIAPALAGREVYTIIWTTTPWTLPASMAVAFHPDFEYVAIEARPAPCASSEPCARTAAEAEPVVYIVAAALAGQVAEACQLVPTRELARFKGAALDRVTFQHPFLERSILGVLATYVTADRAPALCIPRPRTARTTSIPARDTASIPPAASMPAGTSTSIPPRGLANPPAFDGMKVFAANPVIWPCWKSAARCWAAHLDTPIRIAGAATIRSFFALPSSGSFRWKRREAWRRIGNHVPPACDRGDRQSGVGPGVGQGAHHQHDRHAPRLVHQPAAHLGRSHRGFPMQECNQPIIDADLNRKIVDLFEREGVEAWHDCRRALPAA